ncbi:MAG: hypothetical protein A3I38_02460 [Candidatus Wildermuthbacteria bacterium RIFCSPLOWO2_02_FULL_47_10]|uniref:Uncharacterized protein n=1 Tax=Candidatus Wildermuthbacteria bacterium RIFCSPHIGHO2_02_FULL_47_17 TaxID=1802452 RepID=A0A1G2R3J3_9BACT|nr:MAG: hypothetical protein A3D59_00095 [Candidatus Wildermuthbacteria bacterium RIFCSPHIGHO2_02_FULL_47_17]OHA75195.1 MAG: hypothetical protein A3I38_02460 [Candidatus Wildermuthbacteria bacterium RIFCSPLOWO2_02_FULL_47_10]
MADIFFLLAGIVLFFKKEVHISRKRKLSGRPVKILAVLYVLPFAVGLIAGFFISAFKLDPAYAIWISTPLVVIAILATLYLIFFHKEA